MYMIVIVIVLFFLFKGYSSPLTCITRKTKNSLLIAGLENGHIVIHNMSIPQTPLVELTTDTQTIEVLIIQWALHYKGVPF